MTMAGASQTTHLDTHTKRIKTPHTFAHLAVPPYCLTALSLPANVRFDALSSDGCHAHGHGLRRGQPVGIVVTGGKVADVVNVAEHKGHGAEPAQTAAGCAWKRMVYSVK